MGSLQERRLLRAVMWKRLDVVGIERCELWREREGWSLVGAIVVERPFVDVRYEVHCDALWRTHAVDVRVRAGSAEHRLELSVEPDGRWWNAGREVESVRGCVDVDLQLTPATNTLPVRRMGLAIGETRQVTAAWVRFPELDVAPLEQRYTRTGPSTFRYESPGFGAELAVDELELVTRYEGLWERVRDSDERATEPQ